MNIISNSPTETQSIARKLAGYLKPGDVIALIGNLGSGKTVFVKGLARGLGCAKDVVVSPTFVILQRYKGKAVSLNHFDLYRLKDIEQLCKIGYEEYFYSDEVAVVEWADRIEEALPENYLRIELKALDQHRRLIKIIAKGKSREFHNILSKVAGKKPCG